MDDANLEISVTSVFRVSLTSWPDHGFLLHRKGNQLNQISNLPENCLCSIAGYCTPQYYNRVLRGFAHSAYMSLQLPMPIHFYGYMHS